MHPDPKHLKNFARNTQWSRGKRTMNNRFLSRSHAPGFERLNARGRVCHLIRAIGHHIVRLACRSVTIMARLTACWSHRTWTKPRNITDADAERLFNRQSRKPVDAKFVPEPRISRRSDSWLASWQRLDVAQCDLRISELRTVVVVKL